MKLELIKIAPDLLDDSRYNVDLAISFLEGEEISQHFGDLTIRFPAEEIEHATVLQIEEMAIAKALRMLGRA